MKIIIFADMPERNIGAPILPLSKDVRMKEENTKLVNGNPGDPVDWV